MKTFKYSKGLQTLIESVYQFAPNEFFAAIRKAVTRKSRKVAYPCDLLTFNIVLECTHDVTGEVFSVTVEEKDIPYAFLTLSRQIQDEDYYLELFKRVCAEVDESNLF